VKAARDRLLDGAGWHAYNNEKFAANENCAARHGSEKPVEGAIMESWEEIGKKLDAEFDRVRKLIETEIKPQTKNKTAKALREAAERLNKAADKLDESAKNNK
jgi:hypothetical protein